jgi:succinate dehydrogenase/fumarate reductase flavoprotein subunit
MDDADIMQKELSQLQAMRQEPQQIRLRDTVKRYTKDSLENALLVLAELTNEPKASTAHRCAPAS